MAKHIGALLRESFRDEACGFIMGLGNYIDLP